MVNITNIDPNTLTLQTISPEDVSIIPNTIVTSSFNPVNDRVEYFVYDFNNNLLSSNNDLRSYKPVLIDASGNIIDMNLFPEADAVNAGYTTGIVKTIYNFISPQVGSGDNPLFISEISPSRTELRLSSNGNSLFNAINETATSFASSSAYEIYTQFRQNIESNNYLDEFYLNFGNNIYIIGVNSVLEFNPQNNTVSLLIKLYEPLPTSIGLKTELSLVLKKAESVAYQLDFTQEELILDTTIKISGPNYNIPIKDETGPLTQFQNYNTITSTPLSGSLFQLMNQISASSIDINVDYTDYEDFIFFSSAYQRLYNFKEKVTSISASQAQLNNLYTNITGSTSASFAVSSSKLLLEKEIETTITSFDGYEYFLYYTSGSYAWPKSNNQAPYILYPPTSTQAINWYATQSAIAIEYDENNQNNLEYVVPEYIRYNSSNTNYMLFTSMIGQFFDEIWLYTKAITAKLDANSNLYEGVSKDVVSTVLESLGTKIYDSTYTLENIYSSLIGLSANGALYPTTGSQLVTNYVTASVSNPEDVPTIDDFVRLSYKKIYNALPYLLKKKGTNAGLRSLINIFGIPDTILQINEFGGKNKVGNNDWDYWQDKFNYKLDITNTGSDYISIPWQVNTSWSAEDNRPNTLQFRFKTPGLNSALVSPSQSLWNLDNSGNTSLVLEYTGSGYSSGSYSGSIPSSSNEYATLKFIPNYGNDPASSASIYLPFYDGGWWSVMVTRDDDNWVLYAANKIYNGDDGFIIGYTGSATSSGAVSTAWATGTNSYFGSNGNLTIGSKTYNNFSGSYQEVRYYNTVLPSGTFYDYTMNPYSIEGVGINGAYDQLIFRGTLGNDLYTASKSMHPKITGSYITQSFASNSNFTINNGTFSVNREFVFQDQIPAGMRNAVSKKIKNISTILPYSGSEEVNLPVNTVLSPFIPIDQDSYNSSSYVEDIKYVEVAFSPQNEINEDINAQIGYFNIGDYIGDPRLVSSSAETYPELDALSKDYFDKYYSNYNLWDYIRLIRYYDNALFKMIKDYVPVRSSLTTGIVIKQHILERNKYPVPQPDLSSSLAMVSSNATSSAILFQSNNEDVSGGLCYPITASGVYNLYVTGSITNTSGDNPTLFDIYVTSSYGISVLFSQNVNLNATIPFSGSYDAYIPSGSSLCFVPDSLGDFFTNNVTASLLIANTSTFPYTTQDMLITGSPIQMYTITGSTGGTMPDLYGLTSSEFTGNNIVNITQSWDGINSTPVGLVPFTDFTQMEFYDGELSGSYIQVENGELNEDNPYKMASTQILVYDTLGQNSATNPGIGEIYWHQSIGYNGSNYFLFIDALYINETSKNSVDIESALDNLKAGDKITLTVTFNIGSPSVSTTSTVTGTIATISPQSQTVRKMTFVGGTLSTTTIFSGTGVLSSVTTGFAYDDAFDVNVILDPFLNDAGGFDNSPFNPLIDNAVISRPNFDFFDVDFASNAITAVNSASIINASRGSGSATPSTTPQSNYTTLRVANPRHLGCKNTSPNFNVGYSNLLPSVEIDGTWFAYFDWVGGTTPEIINKAGFHIKYLIDTNGNVLTPNLTGSYYDNLTRVFNEQNPVNIIFQAGQTSGNVQPLQGTKPVIKSGALGQAVIFSQTGSNPGFLLTMSFSDATPPGNDYNINVAIQSNSSYDGADTFHVLDLTTPAVSGSTATTASLIGANGNYIELQISNAAIQVVPKLYVDYQFIDIYGQSATVTFTIQKSTNNGSTWTNYFSSTFGAVYNVNYQRTIVGPADNAIDGNLYRAVVSYTTQPNSINYIEMNDGDFYLSQIPPISGSVTSSYWTTGSLTPKILTGSQFTQDIYGSLTQTTISGSGYDSPYQLFTVQIGDEIRFSADENQVYQIIGVTPPQQNNNKLYLNLDKNIVGGTNLNSFLLRRYVPNPNFVLVNATKTDQVGEGPGFLLPEYASQEVLTKFDNIVADLTEKGLI